MEHRSLRGRVVRAWLLVPVRSAVALAGAQDPQSKTRERPPEPPKTERPQDAPKPPEAQKPTRPPTAHANPAGGTRPLEERRAIAKDAARFEAKYRNAVARIDRLVEVYKGKGDQEHVLQLERLRERLAVRREHALEGFRKELGEDGFRKMQGQLQGGGRKSLEERTKKAKPPGGGGF